MNDTTAWVHQGDDEPCDLFTVETASDLDRGICGHGQRVIEVYTEAHQEPVDPDTLFVTRMARDFLQVIRYSDSAVALDVTMNLWTSLTGLSPADATAYAERLVAQAGEVTAHVAPF